MRCTGPRNEDNGMNIGIRFQTIWYDQDVVKLRVSAWNGDFGGVADIYEGIGDLHKAATQLQGFPRNPSDTRELIFGTFDRKCAGGGVSMRFHCTDSAGHAHVETRIDSSVLSGGTFQTVLLALPIEATAVDLFVRELQRMEEDRSSTAHLTGLV